jgi:phenylpyruvate tautomerase PptA (4-oxalocrotonate tautomerase family)
VPMVELTTTNGALDDEAKQKLSAELSTIVLELEAAPLSDFGDDEHMQALAWCFVNEQDVFAGGQSLDKPLYRVICTLPEGAPGLFGPSPMAQHGRHQLAKRVTAAVLEAEGSENNMVEAHRVWVQLRFLSDGHWAGFGELVTIADLANYGLKTDEAGSKTERMRQAALESVGAATPA